MSAGEGRYGCGSYRATVPSSRAVSGEDPKFHKRSRKRAMSVNDRWYGRGLRRPTVPPARTRPEMAQNEGKNLKTAKEKERNRTRQKIMQKLSIKLEG